MATHNDNTDNTEQNPEEPAADTVDEQAPEQDATDDTGEPADTADNEADESDKDWKAEAEKWKALARKHEREKKAKANSSELDELREQVSSHETAATEARNALATERLHTKLARAGMPEDDATALIEHLDPSRLLEDGKPSTKAIDAVAASLSRSLTRGVDEDQGQTSEAPSFSPDQWLRKKARTR